MKFKFTQALIAAMVFSIVICASGCEFGTYIKTDKRPEVSVDGFFECLKSKDFEGCNEYLANGASFEITNSTGFDFADSLLDAQLESLEYEIVSDTDINNGSAECRVNITCIAISDVEAAMSGEYSKVRSEYMLDNDLTEFSNSDTEALNAVVLNTFNKIIDSVEPTQRQISVTLNFQDNMWKIVSDDAFCASVLGGNAE
jgi:hypothetical protein